MNVRKEEVRPTEPARAPNDFPSGLKSALTEFKTSAHSLQTALEVALRAADAMLEGQVGSGTAKALSSSLDELRKQCEVCEDKIKKCAGPVAASAAPKKGLGRCEYTHWTSGKEATSKLVCLYSPTTNAEVECEIEGMHMQKCTSTIIVAHNLYIIGGNEPTSARVYTVRIDQLDASFRLQAVKKSHMRAGRGGIGLQQHAGKRIYAIGGRRGPQTIKCCERYEIADDCWTALPQLGEGRHFPAVCELGGMIYAIGGHRGPVILHSIERMNMIYEEERWSKVDIQGDGAEWEAMCGCGAERTGNCEVMIFGGKDSTRKNREECYSMTVEKTGLAVIRRSVTHIAEADSFRRIYSGVVIGAKLYVTSDQVNVHIYDMKKRSWNVITNPWQVFD